ncbi:MAG: DNA photolyase [Omnitrophica bacterium RIFCSPHIGHO2_02_FULL_46_11]|nr:MAG: DNA photolyase [Omnitrophica bacterium RIFCSPLOWO2_01_FULL_45_10b]OGW86836.1 MAG: DNA photolyase [Omnitrophica bacterium RIFCSPHIGHO2_02_FULL_46_11]
MIDTVYIEKEIESHPRTKEVCERFPKARRVFCERYGEVFNPNAQNFRLQKQKPALILAKKFDHFILKTQKGYGIGGDHNFYFSHMLNCLYDCRYCFLQGMYRSAHFVFFVNYEDFEHAIEKQIKEAGSEESYFFSGYDCDSLAFEPVTGFTSHFLPLFARHPKAWLELRTKSIQIKPLLEMKPVQNCVIAFSLTPTEIGAALEAKTPAVTKRLEAMEKLQERGWKLGLRFDPLIYHAQYQEQYERLFREVFKKIKIPSVHSVSLGPFRLPKQGYETMFKLYPEAKLFAGPLEERKGMVSYAQKIEEEMLNFITSRLLEYVPKNIFFPCLI